MEEGQKHIDDFFREELGNYTEMPPEKVWEELSQRLDDTRRPRFGGWWPWIVMLLLIGSVAGYMAFHKKGDPGNPGNPISMADKGLSVSSNGLHEAQAKSGKTKAEDTNTSDEKAIGSATTRKAKNTTQKTESNKAEGTNTSNEKAIGGATTRTAKNTTQKTEHDKAEDTNTSNEKAIGRPTTRTAKNTTSKTENYKAEGTNTSNEKAISGVTTRKVKNTTQKTEHNKAEDTNTSNEKAIGSATTRTAKTKKSETQSTTAPASKEITATNANVANKQPNERQSRSLVKAESEKPKVLVPSPRSSNKIVPKKISAAKSNASPYKPRATQQNPATPGPVSDMPNGTKNETAQKTKATNKTAKTPVAANEPKKPTVVVPAAAPAKKPLPEPKPVNVVAKTNTFQPTPNPANNLLIKPAEESKKALDEEKDDEDNDKAAMNDEGDENEAKPQPPQPAAEHDPRAGIPVSSYIDKSVVPQAKAADEEEEAADKKKIELQNPAGGAGGNMSPSIAKDRKPPGTLEGGAKFGFEKGFSTVTSNKWVATIYLQYNLSPKAAFLVQPSVKFAQMNKSINSSQSFYNVTGTTINSTQRMDSVSTPPFFDTVYNYYYKQTYDSVHVTQTSNKNYVEFEIPLIFKYTIAENLSLLAGVTMNFGSIPTVSSSSTTYSGLTLQDSVVNVHSNPNYQISVNDSFHHTAAPIDSYNPNTNQNPATNPIRFGYLLGMNYLLKDRVLFDLTIQQSFSKMNNVPNADIRSVLTQPYVRFSVGYKIFGSKKKAPQQ